MSGYLIKVSYKVLGVDRAVMIGVDDRSFPNVAAAIDSVKATVIKLRATKKETITNVAAMVVQRR